MNRTTIILLSVLCSIVGMFAGMLLAGAFMGPEEFTIGIVIALTVGFVICILIERMATRRKN